LKNRVIKSPHN